MNIPGKAHRSNWLRRMCIRPKCSAPLRKESGIAPVDRLIGDSMSRQPYKSARRVFWIMTLFRLSRPKGGRPPPLLLGQRGPRAHPLSMPVGSIRIEIYFFIVRIRGRYSRSSTFNPAANSSSDCWLSSGATRRKPLLLSSGLSLAKTQRPDNSRGADRKTSG